MIHPDAQEAVGSRSLLDDNDRFVERVRGDCTTIWVEDHFQWDNRPVVECWIALSMLAAKHTGLTFGALVLVPSMMNLSSLIRSVVYK
jgi:alkanesulfonate monooxygenase SsuD/methylene tetrahydromethanopterin reductase-like flavin-dependent oxidoreductase (luciferase family)